MALIVVVEDEAPIAEFVRYALEDVGHEVVIARDGRRALRVVEERRPALVLSDVMLPLLDGWSLLRAIGADPELRSIPTILMSAAPYRPPDGTPAPAAFLPKPFDLAALHRAVDQLLSESEKSGRAS